MRQELLWPAEDLPAALAALAPAAGLSWTIESGEQGDTVPSGDPRTVGVESTAAALGLDVQSAPRGRERAEQKLRSVAPALVPVSDDRVVAVVSAGRRRAVVAAPAGGVVRVPTSELAAAVPREDGASWWLVRSSPGSGFWRQCRQAGVPVRLVLFVAAHAAEYGLFLWSWAVLGRAAFAGDVSDRTLLAWALLLAATVPARVVATRQQAAVAIGAGWLLRRRLLHGTLRLTADQTRREGAGQLLGRSLEAEAVEDLAINGGLLGVLAAVELTMAVGVLAAGPGPLLAVVLVGWVGLTLVAARQYVQRRRQWATARLDMTHDLIEKMVGHRTRLVQQPPEQWHEKEEDRLSAYAGLGRNMDRRLSALLAFAPRGWMVAAVGALGVEIAWGASPASVAVGAGGILLALSALTRLVNGLAQLGDAAVAWSQVAPLFAAGAHGTAQGTKASPGEPEPGAGPYRRHGHSSRSHRKRRPRVPP